MAYLKLIGCRIVYFLGFNVAIAALFGYEDSLINPGEAGYFVYFLFSILGGFSGVFALRRNIQENGFDQYELFTSFATIVFGIGAFVIGGE